MLIRKAYKYRIYPTAEQERRLVEWQNALRFLWNLANEQRLIDLNHPRGYRRYPNAFDQAKEMKDLRADLPWLADVPRDSCAQVLAELEYAWQRYFKKISDKPQWKKKNRSTMSICGPHPRKWRLEGTDLTFPKLGILKTVVHRPVVGKPKTCTLTKETDQWFAVLVYENEISDPAPRTYPIVALDRGVVNVVADSDGNLIQAPRFLKRTLKRLQHSQRTLSRRKKGSKRREKARIKVSKLHRKIRRQRAHFVHVLSRRYANSHGTVVIEKLNTLGMMHANRGLSRGIADASWGNLARCLRYKLEQSGGRLIDVPANYSSQECSVCGHIDAASRQTQAVFKCVRCGHSDHADLNAAKTLLNRANRSVLTVEGSSIDTRRNGKSVKLRIPRRTPKNSVLIQS